MFLIVKRLNFLMKRKNSNLLITTLIVIIRKNLGCVKKQTANNKHRITRNFRFNIFGNY